MRFDSSVDEDAGPGGSGGGAGGRGGRGGGGGGSGGGGSGGGGQGGGMADGSSAEAGETVMRDSAGERRDGVPMTGTPYVYVTGGNSEIIRVYALDMATGALAPRSMVTGVTSRPGYMAFSADKKYAYGGGSTSMAIPTAKVTGYSIDQATGALTKMPDEGDTGTGTAAHIAVDPSGKWALTAHFGTSQVAVIALGANGAPGMRSQLVMTAVQAHQIFFDATGKFVFVPCREGNLVQQYRFDPVMGMLTPNTPPTVPALAPVAGPRHMYIHQNARWAYVLNERNGTVTSYNYDAAAGTLTMPDTISTVPPGFTEMASAHILVHPNGQRVYASNRTHNSIGIFSINAANGRLTLASNELGGGMIRQPRNFTIDPTGTYLLVANQMASTLIVFRINPADGTLTLVGTPVTGLGGPTFVGVLAL